MKAHPWAARLVALALVLCLTGCESSLTGMLWERDRFQHLSRPAMEPELTVFYAPHRKDFLIRYETEGRLFTRSRSFYLGENYERIQIQKKPRFTAARFAKLEPVPLNQGTNVLPAALGGEWFRIITEQGEIGPYPLPTYDDGSGTALQVVLTPFAVAGDLALFGLIIGVASGLAYAAGSCVNCSR